MNRKLIHQIWLGGAMPDGIKELVQTIDDIHPTPQYEHKIWTEKEFAEAGIDIHQFDQQNVHAAGVSGGLRLLLVEKYGGVYMDCDVQLLKSLDGLLGYEAFAAPQDHRLCNAVFGAVAGHPWIKWQIENVGKFKNFDPTWSTLLMDEAPREGVTILPKDTFYPWLWNTPEKERFITNNTIAIHHWDGSWGKISPIK